MPPAGARRWQSPEHGRHHGVPAGIAPPPPPHRHPAAVALVRERDHFTQAEVTALLSLPTLSQRDRLVLRILAETGLRRRAVAWLTVAGVYDAIRGAAHEVGHATEKGLCTHGDAAAARRRRRGSSC